MCVDPVYVREMCGFRVRCARILAHRAGVCMHLGTAMRVVNMRMLIYQHKISKLAKCVGSVTTIFSVLCKICLHMLRIINIVILGNFLALKYY